MSTSLVHKLNQVNLQGISHLAFIPIAVILKSFEAHPEHCVGNEQDIFDYFVTN